MIPADGKSIALTALGSLPGGESDLTCTWETTSIAAGADLPTFSDNGDNVAKDAIASLSGAGR